MRDCTLKLKLTHDMTRLAVMLAESSNDNPTDAILAANQAWVAYLEHYNPWLDN